MLVYSNDVPVIVVSGGGYNAINYVVGRDVADSHYLVDVLRSSTVARGQPSREPPATTSHMS